MQPYRVAADVLVVSRFDARFHRPLAGAASLALLLPTVALLSACGASVTVDDAHASPDNVGGGGAPPTTASSGGAAGSPITSGGGSPSPTISCEDVCANEEPAYCSSPASPGSACLLHCERVVAAYDRCTTEVDALLACLAGKACSPGAHVCLPELKTWTVCSGTFCGSCLHWGGTGMGGTSCTCLGLTETSTGCSDGTAPCTCFLWNEPWPATPGGWCDWPYEAYER